jgi:hypothetical protein
LPTDPHEEFRELCALATTGELTAEESSRLAGHLAHCDACRRISRQYEQVITTAIPALAVEAAGEQTEESAPGAWSVEEAEARLMDSLTSEPAPLSRGPVSSKRTLRSKPIWHYAMVALILLAFGAVAYRIGVLQARRPEAGATRALTQPKSPDQPSARSSVSARAQSPAPDSQQIARLQSELRESRQQVASLEDRLNQLEVTLATQKTDLGRSIEDRAELNQELTQAQTDAQTLQTRVTTLNSQASQDTARSLSLKTRIEDLNTQIQAKDMEIAQEQQLLQHDRDIRNLIGARKLYIAEIYDVAKNGDTQKPFGRIFYTKDKSLVFYGYDLDQQKGIRKNTAFQAWGRCGADKQNDVSLGLLYQDDSNQKRWVLKFNDSKTIADIDAVFITVEPEGGSPKPTGKPLLFTYLRLDPNHP